jgi:hypothetical protein
MHFDLHSIKKLERDGRSRHFEPSMMVFDEIRRFPNVNFFTLSRSVPALFPVKLPLWAVPFKHVPTVNALADPGTERALDHHSGHAKWRF